MLEIRNAKKEYDNTLFEHLTIRFPKVGFFTILGPSGCGKTSLINILSGIETLDEGEIYFNDKIIKKNKFQSFRKKYLNFLFQDYGVIDYLTIKQNLLISNMILRRKPKKKEIIEQLHNLGLDKDLNTKCYNLSGGEKQRVGLARILLNPKEIIICDEPTGSLDLENANIVFSTLKELSKKHLVIVVTHDKESAYAYSDYIFDFKTKKIKTINKVISNSSNESLKTKNISFINQIGLCQNSLKHRPTRTLLSIIAYAFVMLFFLLSICLSTSISDSVEYNTKNYIDYNHIQVSIEDKSEIGNSGLNFVKSTRPSREKLENLLTGKHYQISYCLDYLFQGIMIFNNDQLIENVLIKPIDFLNETSFKKYNQMVKDFTINDVFINQEASKLLTNNIKISIDQKIESYDRFYNRVYDYFKLETVLKVKEIVNEFSFMSIPTIYYSNQAWIKYLKAQKIENLSLLLNQNHTYYERFSSLSNNSEDASSYCFDLYLDQDEVMEVKEILENENFKVSSQPLEIADNLYNILDSVSSILMIFVFLSFLIVIALVSIVLYSLIIDCKKEIGLLMTFGVDKYQINEVFCLEGVSLSLAGMVISLIIINFVIRLINDLVNAKIGIDSLINIPIIQNSIGFYVFALLFSVLIGGICGFIPSFFSSRIKIADMLKED